MMRMPSPGPGNGWRQTISSGTPSSRPTRRTSSLNSVRSGSTRLELQVLRQPPDVVVALDGRGAVATAGLDDVRVQRALDEELDRSRPRPADAATTSAAASSKTRMNSRPMILRLVSGSLTPASAREEPVRGVHDDEVDAGRGHEVLLDLLHLALAQQAVVDEHARQPVTDGPLDERGRDRGVDPARQPADGAGVPDLGPDGLDLVGMTLPIVQVGAMPAISCRKCSRTAWPWAECSTSGWNCTPARRRSGSSKAATGVPVVRATTSNPVGRLGHGVAVGHPHRLPQRQAVEQGGVAGDDVQLGAAELGPAGPLHGAAQRAGHRLEAVADAERGHPGLEQLGADVGSALGVHRRRPAGQDDRGRVPLEHLPHRHGVRDDLAVDPRLADAPGDELGVLRAEVDDEDGRVDSRRVFGHGRRGPRGGAGRARGTARRPVSQVAAAARAPSGWGPVTGRGHGARLVALRGPPGAETAQRQAPAAAEPSSASTVRHGSGPGPPGTELVEAGAAATVRTASPAAAPRARPPRRARRCRPSLRRP